MFALNIISMVMKMDEHVMEVSLPQGKGTMHYGLVIVGHSLGAGTAAILSFLLRPQYPTLECYSYSPPGGLLR